MISKESGEKECLEIFLRKVEFVFLPFTKMTS